MGFDVDTVLSQLQQNEKIALLSGEILLLDTIARVLMQSQVLISGIPNPSPSIMYLQYA